MSKLETHTSKLVSSLPRMFKVSPECVSILVSYISLIANVCFSGPDKRFTEEAKCVYILSLVVPHLKLCWNVRGCRWECCLQWVTSTYFRNMWYPHEVNYILSTKLRIFQTLLCNKYNPTFSFCSGGASASRRDAMATLWKWFCGVHDESIAVKILVLITFFSWSWIIYCAVYQTTLINLSLEGTSRIMFRVSISVNESAHLIVRLLHEIR